MRNIFNLYIDCRFSFFFLVFLFLDCDTVIIGEFMKKILSFLILLLAVCPILTLAVVPKSNFVYVSDYANILDSNTASYIIDYSSFLKKETQIEFYVVTLKTLDGSDVDAYSNQLYDSFCSNNKGLIILFSKKERLIKVIAGSNLSTILPNDVIDELIQSYFMPFFKNEEWNLGIQNGYNALYKRICDAYHIDASAISVLDGNDFLTKYKTFILLFITWVGITITYVCCVYFLKIYHSSYTSRMDDFIFILMFFTNIMLLALTGLIDSTFVFILLALEILCFIFIYVSLRRDQKEKRRIRNARMKQKKRKKK